MRINWLLTAPVCLLAVMILAALTTSSQGWTQESSVPSYHLLKKIVLGGRRGKGLPTEVGTGKQR
jgi:hypothetical protein